MIIQNLSNPVSAVGRLCITVSKQILSYIYIFCYRYTEGFVFVKAKLEILEFII